MSSVRGKGPALANQRGGRYHNRLYRRLALELGLDVAQDGTREWTDTTVPAPTAAAYRDTLAELEGALELWPRAEASGGRTASRGPAPQRIRWGASRLAGSNNGSLTLHNAAYGREGM